MSHLPPNVAAGLIEAGGCSHTPEPWRACSTCGRPIPPWALATDQRIEILDWRAMLIDGQSMEKRDVLSIDNVPKDRLTDLKLSTTSPRAPVVQLVVDPREGEQAHMFTRRMMRVGMRAGGTATSTPSGTHVSVVVLEVTPRRDGKVRLYVHPDRLILSTQDLYF